MFISLSAAVKQAPGVLRAGDTVTVARGWADVAWCYTQSCAHIFLQLFQT